LTRVRIVPFLSAVHMDDIGYRQNNLTSSFVVLYADYILLLAPSVAALQALLRACEHEFESKDMLCSYRRTLQ